VSDLDDLDEYPATAKGNVEMMAEVHRQFAPRQVSIDAFLLEYGEEFEANPTPEWVELMAPKMCFMNCYILAQEWHGGLLSEDIPELFYCEGYVHSSGLPIPIHHAWLVDADGTLIEPTLRDRTAEEEITYFGVKIPDFDSLEQVLDETETYSILFKEKGHAMIERVLERKAA
jgi:hypothetical protein